MFNSSGLTRYARLIELILLYPLSPMPTTGYSLQGPAQVTRPTVSTITAFASNVTRCMDGTRPVPSYATFARAPPGVGNWIMDDGVACGGATTVNRYCMSDIVCTMSTWQLKSMKAVILFEYWYSRRFCFQSIAKAGSYAVLDEERHLKQV